MAREKKHSKSEWSWIMYDWANSVYATIVMAAVLPTYFAALDPNADAWWGYGTSIATFVIAILAPVLGAVADYKGSWVVWIGGDWRGVKSDGSEIHFAE